MNIYIQRRIMVAMALVLTLTSAFVTVKAVANALSNPTFKCQSAQVVRGDSTMWNIADTYCSGNITDAAMYIMRDNNIKSEDLMSLPHSITIVIKGGN